MLRAKIINLLKSEGNRKSTSYIKTRRICYPHIRIPKQVLLKEEEKESHKCTGSQGTAIIWLSLLVTNCPKATRPETAISASGQILRSEPMVTAGLYVTIYGEGRRHRVTSFTLVQEFQASSPLIFNAKNVHECGGGVFSHEKRIYVNKSN